MGAIHVDRDERNVATVWLDSPARRNALGNAMISGLCDAFAGLAADDACRAIVLRGRGGVFCAGRDLVDLKALQAAGLEAAARMYHAMQQMNETIYFSPHPVVCVIEKYALGIATMLASWSDIALADEGAQFGYPEVRHGITPYGAVPTMLNTMSQKAMFDLLFTARRIGAAEAVRLGIITRAVAADRLGAELEEVLGHLFRGNAAAIRRSKRFVRECETLSYRQGLAAATDKHILGLGVPEMLGGVASFLDRRKADGS